jgi:anaphase-promoting complex subunit 10
MVSISAMRIYLDFEMDESYTPTLIHFAAGTGYHDLQEFSVMRFNQPQGWIDVDWDGVGGEGEDEDEDDEDAKVQLPVLRCMLIQVRILENHQNGKDTHLRGLQIFAKDPTAGFEKQGLGEMASSRSDISHMPQTRKIETVRRPKKHWADMGDWLDAPVLR